MAASVKSTPSSETHKGPSHDSVRETVESVVIAVILAFLFRGFVAEAFVIPTGSMAPTLQGRHVDVDCPQCGFRFLTGASIENPDSDPRDLTFDSESQAFLKYIKNVTCPMCQHEHRLARSEEALIKANSPYGRDIAYIPQKTKLLRPWAGPTNEDSFNGDRIIVSKFSYVIGEPNRWDVIVFKFPGNAKVNYIKRLVGLPGELLMIHHGDIFTTPQLFTARGESSGPLMERNQIDEALRAAFAEAGHSLSSEADVAVVSDRVEINGVAIKHVIDGKRSYFVAYHEGRLHVFRGEFQVARKPHRKIRAMLHLVHDSDYVAEILHDAGMPLRWTREPARAEQGWSTEDYGRTYRVEAGEEAQWLRYRHRQATREDWTQALGARPIENRERPGELITDFYTYNNGNEPPSPGKHWVPDLALDCELEVGSDEGEVWVDLVRGGRHFRCGFDIATGKATLENLDHGGESRGVFTADDGEESEQATADSPLQGAGRYRVMMANVDRQISVWVGGKLLQFQGPTRYVPEPREKPRWSPGDSGDEAPLGIGCRNAVLKTTRLRVLRDIYYIAEDGSGDQTRPVDYEQSTASLDPVRIDNWNEAPLFDSRTSLYFVVGKDHYVPFGDNSPMSLDARLWNTPHYVTKELLIGKALMIYWPHGWRWPTPWLPNFSRMGRIR